MKYKIMALIILVILLICNCGKNNSTKPNEDNSGVNRAPLNPSSPYPDNGAIDQLRELTLSWDCSDPDADELIYDIYFGTETQPPLVVAGYDRDSYNSGILRTGTTYYWKVNAIDTEYTTIGSVWSFSTREPQIYFTGSYTPPYEISDLNIQNNYAFIAVRSEIQIIDVNNSTNPVYISSFGEYISISGIYAVGNYIYISAWSNGGVFKLDIFDISSQGEPNIIGSIEHISSIGDIQYSNNHIISSYGMVFDVSEPTQPNLVGQVEVPGSPQAVNVEGNYAYIANQDGLVIISLLNPNSPDLISSINSLNFAIDVDVKNNLAYVADVDSGLTIINVEDPSAPYIVSSFQTPSAAMGVFVSSDYAFTADITSLQVIDIHNPETPYLATSYRYNGNPYQMLRLIFVDSPYIYLGDNGFPSGRLLILELIP